MSSDHLRSDNPKNLAASNRIKLALLPPAGIIHGAHACMDGAGKYGPYNWREKSIALMEYASAAKRHLDDWIDGEDEAPDSHCHHLGHVIATCAIMLDAIELGNAIDDRPPPGKASEILARLKAKLEEKPVKPVEIKPLDGSFEPLGRVRSKFMVEKVTLVFPLHDVTRQYITIVYLDDGRRDEIVLMEADAFDHFEVGQTYNPDFSRAD